MATLIKGRRVVENPSSSEVGAGSGASSEVQGEVIRLEPTDDPAKIAERLGALARIEVNFPKFGDGRGLSIARLLRERYGYRGELRAVGQVARDLLSGMEKCGFDSFELREGEDVQEALAAFDDFSEGYQTSVARPVPLFRRRLEKGA
jgi:uncharacterized protein (DUF934 family)